MCVCLQVRFMVRRPLLVDDSTVDQDDEDDLDLVEGAAATGTAAGGAAPTESLAGPAVEKKKSVRLAAEGECRALCKYRQSGLGCYGLLQVGPCGPGVTTVLSAPLHSRLQHSFFCRHYLTSLAARGVSAVASASCFAECVLCGAAGLMQMPKMILASLVPPSKEDSATAPRQRASQAQRAPKPH